MLLEEEMFQKFLQSLGESPQFDKAVVKLESEDQEVVKFIKDNLNCEFIGVQEAASGDLSDVTYWFTIFLPPTDKSDSPHSSVMLPYIDIDLLINRMVQKFVQYANDCEDKQKFLHEFLSKIKIDSYKNDIKNKILASGVMSESVILNANYILEQWE